uniref:Transcription factor Sp4 n=1 Tax=Globodera pallida TaxID=36090 RepID=A0A183CDQ0_GLOPA
MPSKSKAKANNNVPSSAVPTSARAGKLTTTTAVPSGISFGGAQIVTTAGATQHQQQTQKEGGVVHQQPAFQLYVPTATIPAQMVGGGAGSVQPTQRIILIQQPTSTGRPVVSVSGGCATSTATAIPFQQTITSGAALGQQLFVLKTATAAGQQQQQQIQFVPLVHAISAPSDVGASAGGVQQQPQLIQLSGASAAAQPIQLQTLDGKIITATSGASCAVCNGSGERRSPPRRCSGDACEAP